MLFGSKSNNFYVKRITKNLGIDSRFRYIWWWIIFIKLIFIFINSNLENFLGMYFRGFPVVQGAIHYLVWSNTLLQISLLFSVEIVSFFLCAYSQMRKKIVKIKTVFSVECILDLIALLNFLIYLKYIFLQSFIDE